MKKPFINALLAELYIATIVSVIQYGIAPKDAPDNILIPIMMLSLFVLSAAVMGYLFLAEPLQLYLNNKKKEAVSFFMQTVATFAGTTALILILWTILLS